MCERRGRFRLTTARLRGTVFEELITNQNNRNGNYKRPLPLLAMATV